MRYEQVVYYQANQSQCCRRKYKTIVLDILTSCKLCPLRKNSTCYTKAIIFSTRTQPSDIFGIKFLLQVKLNSVQAKNSCWLHEIDAKANGEEKTST